TGSDRISQGERDRRNEEGGDFKQLSTASIDSSSSSSSGSSSSIMPEVSINVRQSNGEKFTTEVDTEATVLTFKQKISEKAGVAPELQRLIYKGRVMKEDQNTLASYTVEADSTVHLVRSQARPAPTPTSAAGGNTTSPAGAAPQAGRNPFGGGMPGAGGAANPFAEMMGSMGGAGGGMDINRMQQQLMSNPEMMANIMNSPMMEGLLNNPDMLRNIMFSNPQMQQVMQNNPQLAQVLNDPAMMRQYLDMARNPEAMNQARRSQDLMMSQIENQPGGFNALRRLYTEVQEPMMQASEGMVGNDNPGTNNTATPAAANPSAGPNTSALPNPWAAPGTTAAPSGGTNAPAPVPGAGGANANPWAALQQGLGAGAGGMPGGAQMDPAMMQEMMNNPMIQQMVTQMADDPAIMESMIAQNPMLQQAMQANPALRGQLPQFMRRMADPQNVQALAQMQQSMQQLQRSGIYIHPRATSESLPSVSSCSSAFSLVSAPSSPPPAAGGLDFSSLLGGGGGAAASNNPWAVPAPSASSSSSSAPASNPPVAPTPSAAGGTETYAAQLTQMNDMGFTDREACVRALVASQGNVNIAVERMLGGGV
ncbi:unnamed protein product, partial [Scytosiphon promiscuus]